MVLETFWYVLLETPCVSSTFETMINNPLSPQQNNVTWKNLLVIRKGIVEQAVFVNNFLQTIKVMYYIEVLCLYIVHIQREKNVTLYLTLSRNTNTTMS